MVWTPFWTKSAWKEIAFRGASVQARLLSAVQGVAKGEREIEVDETRDDVGWLYEDKFEIEIALRDRHVTTNEDDEEIVHLNAVVVLHVVSRDPDTGRTQFDGWP